MRSQKNPFDGGYQKAEAVYLYIDCKGRGLQEKFMRRLLRRQTYRCPRVYGEDMTFYYIHSMEEDLELAILIFRSRRLPFRKLPTKRRFFWCLAWALILSAIAWLRKRLLRPLLKCSPESSDDRLGSGFSDQRRDPVGYLF